MTAPVAQQPDAATPDAEHHLLTLSTDLIALPNIKQAGNATLDFDGLLLDPLLLHEDLSNGCGGQLWPAGLVLGKYLLQLPASSFQHKTIIELGAGGGLVGLAVAKGISTITAPLYITDQQNMVSLMRTNIEKNGLTGQVEACVYDWGQQPPAQLPPQPNIVLAADCVYFEPAFPLLHQTLVDLIGNDTICYFCFKKRRRADLQFIKGIKKKFVVTLVADDPDHDVYSKQGIFLYTIRKRPAS